MKIVCIGDIHGRKVWKDIVRAEKPWDEVIFLGDYADTHDTSISSDDISSNLDEILRFKEENPESVRLLLGNHDLHYFGHVSRYSGYSRFLASKISQKYLDNLDKFEVMIRKGNILFSHAGLSQDYLDWEFKREDASGLVTELSGPLTEERAGKFSSTARFSGGGLLSKLDFNCYTGMDMYGDSTGQGPLWIRPYSLAENWCAFEKDTVQVVGHTPVNDLKELSFTRNENTLRLFLCDALSIGKYLVIEDGNFIVKSLT